MTPEAFKEKWQAVAANERQAAQSHFIDLCRLLDVPTPTEADPVGDIYAFEKNTLKLGGKSGRADVWKRGHFAWEYKKDRKSLAAAYVQLKQYADGLENPPLLIVSDMKEIRIHTNFNTEVAEEIVVELPDIIGVEARRKLKWAFTDPEKLKPSKTRTQVTAEAAAKFGAIAEKLMRTHERRRVAHFLNRLVFCLFAQDIELLPERIFAEIVEVALKERKPELFASMLADLFRAMAEKNGRVGTTTGIPWFNGGLFDDDDVLPLGHFDVRDLAEAARLDWSAIRPSIFGTLFEQGLDANKRKEMASLFDPQPTLFPVPARGRNADKGVGIHYTDEATIMKIIEPVVLRPLRREWEEAKAAIAAEFAKAEAAKTDGARTRHRDKAKRLYAAFRDRLGRFRVLDPACGSGNFLYLSLQHLKDFDLAVLNEARVLGLPPDDQRITPRAVMGIEINEYAAELARVTIWIGELQWQLRNSFGIHRSPILDSLPGIECRDALLNEDGSEVAWPAADAIVGNPPFLGGKRLITGLGEEYVGRLFRGFDGRVPAEADLVCYWLHKAGAAVGCGATARAGLVVTNSVRGGANRKVIERFPEGVSIFEAWDDEPWVLDGAAVRVSLICIGPNQGEAATLDGRPVAAIHPDLTAQTGASGVDSTQARRLSENDRVSFQGVTKGGNFEVVSEVARVWLQQPVNPNGRPNSDVLRKITSGGDIVRGNREGWVIDFTHMSEKEASFYEKPFDHVFRFVKPVRERNRRLNYRQFWWKFAEPRPGMHKSMMRLSRYILTPKVSRYRVFVWSSVSIIPDNLAIAIAKDDDCVFGILHSKIHELWSLRKGAYCGAGNDPTYTPTSTFATFPFPEGLTPNIPAADCACDPRAIRIAEAARRLNQLRENWLNPPDLVRREPEVVPGYPDRILPVSESAAKELKTRTLTNLYNARPPWLDNIHRELDAAVAAAYGWPADLADDDILKRLLDLNLARAATTERLGDA